MRGFGAAHLVKDRVKSMVTDCPTSSMWFDHFMMGCHSRMGDIVKKDFAVSIEVLHELMRRLDQDWDRATTAEEKLRTAEIGTFCVVCFCGMLRGEEIVMMEMSGIVYS